MSALPIDDTILKRMGFCHTQPVMGKGFAFIDKSFPSAERQLEHFLFHCGGINKALNRLAERHQNFTTTAFFGQILIVTVRSGKAASPQTAQVKRQYRDIFQVFNNVLKTFLKLVDLSVITDMPFGK